MYIVLQPLLRSGIDSKPMHQSNTLTLQRCWVPVNKHICVSWSLHCMAKSSRTITCNQWLILNHSRSLRLASSETSSCNDSGSWKERNQSRVWKSRSKTRGCFLRGTVFGVGELITDSIQSCQMPDTIQMYLQQPSPPTFEVFTQGVSASCYCCQGRSLWGYSVQRTHQVCRSSLLWC